MRYRAQSGAVLTGFVTWLGVGVPGKRKRPTPSCSLPGGVVEGGRELAVCHVQMYGGCYCHNKIQSGQCPSENSVVIEFGLYLGVYERALSPQSIREHDKDSSKRNSRDS